MPDYVALGQTVQRLIRDFGSAQTATLSRRVAGAYDPITDSDPGETFVDYVFEVVTLPAGDAEKSSKLDDLVQSDREVIYVSPLQLAIVPEIGDRIQLPNRINPFAVVFVKQLAPDGGDLLYKMTLDKVAVI